MPLDSSVIAASRAVMPSSARPTGSTSSSLDPAGSLEAWASAVDAFIVDLARVGYSSYTLRDYRTDVMRMAHYLDVAPEDVHGGHLRDMDAFLALEGLGQQARRRRTSAYRKFLEWRRGKLIRESVADKVLALASELRWEDRVLVMFPYLSGMRLAEIAQLEWRDIRRGKELLVCRRGHRLLPLHPTLATLMNERRLIGPLAPYAPILSGPSGFPINPRTLHSRFRRLMAKLGFADVKPEDLRRDAATALMRMGAPDGLLKAFLGKDRGRVTAPRRGRMIDLECLRDRILRLPL